MASTWGGGPAVAVAVERHLLPQEYGVGGHVEDYYHSAEHPNVSPEMYREVHLQEVVLLQDHGAADHIDYYGTQGYKTVEHPDIQRGGGLGEAYPGDWERVDS